MNPTPKINLSAMVKKKTTNNSPEEDVKDIKIETETTIIDSENISDKKNIDSVFKSKEEKEIEKNKWKKETGENNDETKSENDIEVKSSFMPKISLSSIKTTKSVIEIKEETAKEKIDEHARKKEELLEVLEWENINTENITSNTDVKLEEKIAENNVKDGDDDEEIISTKTEEEKMMELAEIEKKINEKVEEEVNKKMKKSSSSEDGETPEILDDKKELFWNYQSEFTEKEEKIIEKVETEKKRFTDRIRLPKTRVLLVVWLILLTIGIIGTLFKMDPKNHSIDIYKNAIVSNVNKINSTFIEKPWVLETINIDWYSFNTYSQKQVIKWIKYKYNEIVYDTKEKMDEVINSEIMVIKQAEEEKKAEQARLEAEKAAIETERLNQEKIKVTKEKIKFILHVKYNELIKKYQQ